MSLEACMAKVRKKNWRTDTSPLETDELPALNMSSVEIYLVFLTGDRAGATVALKGSSYTLGREGEADIVVPDSQVSRVHCRLERTGAGIFVKDLDSKNGVFVDEERIDEVRLSPLSQLRIGSTLMRVQFKTAAETELEKRALHEERMAAVGVLSAGIAHEFNNINAIILGYTELLLLKKDRDETEQGQLEVVREAALRSKELTRDLLLFSGDLGVSEEQASLSDVARRTHNLLCSEYGREGVEFELNLEEVPQILMDRTHIGQVVLHLLVNACHAVMEEPEKRVTLTTGQDGDVVWLRVEDTGCGISPEDLKHVFTPFYSTKGEHSRGNTALSRVKGRGLGLSISQTIMSQHGGSLTAHSEEGQGSAFEMRLPLRQQKVEPVQKKPVAAGASTAHAKSVLVLDDEEMMRKLLNVAIEGQGWSALCTDDGEEALRLVRECPVDMAFIDLQMPKMSGFDFLRELRKIRGKKLPAVFVLTGRDISDKEQEELRQEPVQEIIKKPFHLDTITDLMKVAQP